MSEHYNKDVDDAQKFHAQQGFDVERHCLTEVLDKLSSPGILGLSMNAVEELLSNMYAFVLRPTSCIM